MRKFLCTALLLLAGSSAFSQINLVLNPDFEQYTSCPTANNQISVAKYWTGIDSTGFNACDPDYCHTCVKLPNEANMIPSSSAYWQYPRSGNGMAQAFIFFRSTTAPNLQLRNYLQGRLTKTLSSGKRYCVSFYVNLVEASGYAVKEVSAYLDNGSIDTTIACAAPQSRYAPQVSNIGGIITDTMRWTKIEGSFIANGTERFITIGNFKDNTGTTNITVPIDSRFIPAGGKNYSGYLIDDVSVIESDLKADAGPDKHVGYGDSIFIGRPREVGLECTWTVLGDATVIGTGAGIWVKPTSTTRYVVTQTLCGQVKRDTVRVEVWAARLNSLKGQTQHYRLSPNPGNGHVLLHQSVQDDRPLQIEVYEMTGKRVYSTTSIAKDAQLTMDLFAISPGMYYIKVFDYSGHAYTLKFVRK